MRKKVFLFGALASMAILASCGSSPTTEVEFKEIKAPEKNAEDIEISEKDASSIVEEINKSLNDLSLFHTVTYEYLVAYSKGGITKKMDSTSILCEDEDTVYAKVNKKYYESYLENEKEEYFTVELNLYLFPKEAEKCDLKGTIAIANYPYKETKANKNGTVEVIKEEKITGQIDIRIENIDIYNLKEFSYEISIYNSFPQASFSSLEHKYYGNSSSSNSIYVEASGTFNGQNITTKSLYDSNTLIINYGKYESSDSKTECLRSRTYSPELLLTDRPSFDTTYLVSLKDIGLTLLGVEQTFDMDALGKFMYNKLKASV